MPDPLAPQADSRPSAATDDIVNLWAEESPPDFAYFEAAESEDWVQGFWTPDAPFQRLFAELDVESVLELARGGGGTPRRSSTAAAAWSSPTRPSRPSTSRLGGSLDTAACRPSSPRTA